MNAKLLVRVVSWREIPKPVEWIAREEGLDTKDVRAILRIAGDSKWATREIRLDKYDLVEYLVNQRASMTDIMRTTGADSRTVKRWFPEAGWKAGSEERREALKMSAAMQEFDRKGLL